MRSFLRLTTLVASLLVTAWAVPGCSSNETTGGKMEGAMPSGKMERRHGQGQDGAADKARWRHQGKMDGAMDKGKMGGAMDKGKMDGAMDKGKMEGTSK